VAFRCAILALTVTVGERGYPRDAPCSRTGRHAARLLRKIKAARSVVQAWGLRQILSFFPTLRGLSAGGLSDRTGLWISACYLGVRVLYPWA